MEQRRVESGLMPFEVHDEILADRDDRPDQWLADLVADERPSGFDGIDGYKLCET